MYVPKLYRNENQDEMIDFIRKHNFGILVTADTEGRPLATHIPFVVENRNAKIMLHSHISRANKQALHFAAEKEVLVVFNAEHAYISSSWYDHVNVPTWNYVAVHIYGRLSLLNESQTLDHLNALVDQHEQYEKQPVSVNGMGSELVQMEMKGLIAFEIRVDEMHSAFKLSQNRDEKNIRNIIAELELRGDENSMAIAKAIKKQRGFDYEKAN